MRYNLEADFKYYDDVLLERNLDKIEGNIHIKI